MSQPRRLRTRSLPPCVDVRQRKPSSFGSNRQPEPVGSGPERASIGSGSRSTGKQGTRPLIQVGHVALRWRGVGWGLLLGPIAQEVERSALDGDDADRNLLGSPDRHMDGRFRFTLAGLACVAERSERVWTVTVAEVSVARSESLARAIEAASGGIVAGELADEMARNVEASASTGRVATRRRPVAPVR